MIDNSEEHLLYLAELKNKMVNTCKSLIREEIELVIGVREIAKILYQLFDHKISEDFLPIISFYEQTDDMPIGEQRKYYSEKFLAEMDEKHKKFVSNTKQEIFESCKKVITQFSSEH